MEVTHRQQNDQRRVQNDLILRFSLAYPGLPPMARVLDRCRGGIDGILFSDAGGSSGGKCGVSTGSVSQSGSARRTSELSPVRGLGGGVVPAVPDGSRLRSGSCPSVTFSNSWTSPDSRPRKCYTTLTRLNFD